jgi:P4 family phage/plasmid primase-like protien
MTNHPTQPTNFLKYIGTPLESFVHPIVPRDAKLRDTSKIEATMLGKIPGVMSGNNGEWTGFPWTSHRTTASMLQRWQMWQAEHKIIIPAGLRLTEIVALDPDTDDERYRDFVWGLAEEHFGKTPVVRCRDGSPRIALFYRRTPGTAPIRKFAISFKDEHDQRHLIEFLGTGQQIVGEGPHAKAGAMQYWLGDRHIVDYWDELPELTHEQVVGFYSELRGLTPQFFPTFELLKGKLPSDSDRAAAISVTNLMSPHLEADLELLARAVRSIDLDHPCMDYDQFIDVLRAICAACAGDMVFFTNVVWPWTCTQKVARGNGPRTEDAGIEWLEARWHSFTDSSIGKEFLYGFVASKFGFTEGAELLNDKKAEENDKLADEVFLGSTENSGGDGQVDGAAGNNAGADGNAAAPVGAGGGPTPFPYSEVALVDLFATQNPYYRYTPDQNWVKLENGLYVPDHCIIEPIRRMCSAIGDPYRAISGQDGIDLQLKGHRVHQRVEAALRSHPLMFARPEEFDTDPWLLNTPDGIVDLRTGNTLEHGMLMRQQTSVTPNFCAFADYRYFCPRWLEYLEFISDERDWVISLLQRWGGSNLVGALFDVYFLFIHGKPGTGKTVFLDVLLRLMHLYAKPVSKTFFMRMLDKRTFELDKTFHKRAVFSDEVPKGSTWDEMMLLSMLNGSELAAEGKGKDFRSFRSIASITITGNYRPAFVTSAEEGGLDRRLLVLEVHKKIADFMPDNTRFAEEIVHEEGSAILAWFIQGAMEGWQSLEHTGSFMGDTVKEALVTAKTYRRDANPFLQWIKEDMEEGPEFDTDSKDAFKSYVEHMREQAPRYHISKEDFRMGMEALGFTFGRRTAGQYKGRSVFRGLRYRQDGAPVLGDPSEPGSVVV